MEIGNNSSPWEFLGNIPEGDHPFLTVHMTESTVHKLAATLREIVDMSEIHQDMAPRTTERIWELLTALTGELMAWIEGWRV
ncbi:hypothetical protein ACWDSJ_35900 [Nocardia sp. NPDC003482]